MVLADSLPMSLAERETALPPWQLLVQQAGLTGHFASMKRLMCYLFVHCPWLHLQDVCCEALGLLCTEGNFHAEHSSCCYDTIMHAN